MDRRNFLISVLLAAPFAALAAIIKNDDHDMRLSGKSFTITLPPAGRPGQFLVVNSGNMEWVTVQTSGDEVINGI